MARRDDLGADAFLTEALAIDPGAADVLAALAAALPPATPSRATRDRLFETLGPGPLTRFAGAVARLADLAESRARELLAELAAAVWEPGPAGTELLWVEGGPATAGCIRGFVRLPAGATFPEHTHLGEERLLVLEGAVTDGGGGALRPGEVATAAPGSTHPTIAVGGEPALYFVVIRGGVDLADGTPVRPRDTP
ncbi:MAG: cupin domain-containing protein [Deltaproteobacteria bacterium]|nr:cupin domain-containing protein [Deltaproteobacteria bacterium]